MKYYIKSCVIIVYGSRKSQSRKERESLWQVSGHKQGIEVGYVLIVVMTHLTLCLYMNWVLVICFRPLLMISDWILHWPFDIEMMLILRWYWNDIEMICGSGVTLTLLYGSSVTSTLLLDRVPYRYWYMEWAHPL